MTTYLKVISLCLLISLTVQENAPNRRISRSLNPADVEPRDVVETFSSHIKNLASNANRVQSIQKGVENWIDEGDNLNGRELVIDLAGKLKARLKQKIDAVNDISTAVARALNSRKRPEEPYHRCCELPAEYEVTYDPWYKDTVTDAVVCQMKAPAHLKENVADYSTVKTVFDTNKYKVKWQYFGSVEGISTMFPSSRISKCGAYDNRIRPWYVTTATPSPKNIVILMDSSSSIGYDNNLDAAKDTAKLVVSTLNPQDKVSVILFNSSTFLPGDSNTDECYNTTMAFAGTFTINYLKSFIDRAQPIGGTRFIRAFKKAFQILKNTLNSSPKSIVTRPSMILLLTDGPPKHGSIQKQILEAIKKEVEMFKQEHRDTTFKVLTLLLGGDGQSKSFVKKLAQQTDGISMTSHGKKDPYSKLKGYFDYLMEVTPAKESDVVFSPPYLDAWGLGYMITAASAYFHKNKLRGVAGVDIPMTDLLADVQYFNRAGPKSYAFLVEIKTGQVMSHPMLPTPESITEDPNTLHIFELEQGKEFKELFEQVKVSGKLREKIFSGRTRSTSRGGVLGDGVQTEKVDYKYSCTPVELGEKRKDYIVCVAIEIGDSGAKYKSYSIENQMSSRPITYHRMDVLPEAKTCYHTDTVSYSDRSVIKFSAKAFGDPSGYLEAADSAEAIRDYISEIKDTVYHAVDSDVFPLDSIITTMLTSLVDETWLSRDNQKQYLKKFVRRYIGTYNGVLRMFPGAPLPANFDHTSRPWFIRAVASPGSLSLTAPYLDPLGAGFIVSISQSLKTEYGRKNLFGVVGGDLTISNFGANFKNNIGTKCLDSKGKLRCFLLDTSGYVVYHPDFDNVYNDSSKILNKHITNTDADIAGDLIKSGVMTRKECQNFNLLKLQRFYQITMKNDIHKGKHSNQPHCESYALIKVPETNVFVVVYESQTCFINRPSCPCLDTCTHHESEACECPCKARLAYNVCNATLTDKSDIPMCTQPSATVPKRAPLAQNSADLGRCISLNCGHYDKKHCNEIFGCFWCYTETDGSLLEKPKCMSDRKCYGGVIGRGNPFLNPEIPRRKVNKGGRKVFEILGLKLNKITLIAGSAALGLLVFIAIVIIYCLRRKKAKSDQEQMDFQAMDMFAIENQQQLMDPTDVMNVDQGFGALQLNYPGQSTAMHSTIQLNYPGQSTAMHPNIQLNYPGQSTAMHPNMQLNYPGQSTAMQSNMQMRLGGPGMHFSTQGMSGMWPAQSQLTSGFVPQMSTMQTPGAHPGRSTARKRRPKQPRRVSFSEDGRKETEQEPVTVSEDEPKVTEGQMVNETPEVTEDPQASEGDL